jgi:hypothetical protein
MLLSAGQVRQRQVKTNSQEFPLSIVALKGDSGVIFAQFWHRYGVLCGSGLQVLWLKSVANRPKTVRLVIVGVICRLSKTQQARKRAEHPNLVALTQICLIF